MAKIRLAPASAFPVLPLDDDLHEQLHSVYGTGDWHEAGVLLSSSDLAFAAKASRGAVLAYIETNYFGGQGAQCALLWRDGVLALKPGAMEEATARVRPRPLWPINVVLKALGVAARAGGDEFAELGLERWRHTEDIIENATEIAVPR